MCYETGFLETWIVNVPVSNALWVTLNNMSVTFISLGLLHSMKKWIKE